MARKWLHSSIVGAVLAVALVTSAEYAGATVTMIGTRVIYDANSQGQSLKFTNHGAGPSVIQIWVDSGDEHSTPETANAPFVATPPIFRIEPGAGQTIRLVFTGKDLPQDRESLFFLNTLEIPSLNAAHAGENQMVVMVRKRLKIFYRPPRLEGSPHRVADRLSFRISGEGNDRHVAASNASSYYLSVANGSLVCGSHTATLRPSMVPPRSEAPLNVHGDCPLDATAIRVKVRYVDDYGAVRDAEFPVAAQGTQ
jgi:fimbrial chaperone protein